MQDVNVERLLAQVRNELDRPVAAATFAIPAERYLEPARCARERGTMFGGFHDGAWHGAPRMVAAASALSPRACLPIDVLGASVIVSRDGDGAVHAAINACRHRGTRLVDAPCEAKAIVCPYHGWTYDLAGKLKHVPHAETFGRACEHRDLVSVPIDERHGLLWLGGDAARYLGDVDGDVAALGLERAVTFRTARTVRSCNWKLVVEAFLDGYHLRQLHRDSVYRFFLDGAFAAEQVGAHVRAVVGRRPLREDDGSGRTPLRELATPSLHLFPGTIFIEHPESVSIMVVEPLAPDRCAWEHHMLVPA
jgi:phenylpropionate dioxygenase-like ring-hydroxylating dioxygenase large terminal subunit